MVEKSVNVNAQLEKLEQDFKDTCHVCMQAIKQCSCWDGVEKWNILTGPEAMKPDKIDNYQIIDTKKNVIAKVSRAHNSCAESLALIAHAPEMFAFLKEAARGNVAAEKLMVCIKEGLGFKFTR